jgi:hypothetical protein
MSMMFLWVIRNADDRSERSGRLALPRQIVQPSVQVDADADAPTPINHILRRFAHPMALIGTATTLLTATGARGPVVGALFAIVMTVWPATLFIDRLRPRTGVERVLAILAIDLTSWMIVAHVLLTVGWWHPGPVIALLTGALTIAHLRGDRPAPRPAAVVRRWSSALDFSGTIVITGVAACWLIGATMLSTDSIGDWGLISNLPVIWLLGYAVIIAFTAAWAVDPAVDPRRVVAAIALVVTMTYGTLAVTTTTLRYPWSYKHIGVIRLLDETGTFHPTVDIYNNFSGFFGLGALVRGGTGVDPVSYGAWSQFVGTILLVIAVWVLVQRATGRVDVAHLAALLYVITDWVGQNYFAPQTLGSFLSVAVLALSISWFSSARTRKIPLLGRWLRPLGPATDTCDTPSDRMRRWIISLIFLGLLMTHPLTPISTLMPLAAAFALGWIRDRRLLPIMAIAVLLWTLRSLPYFIEQAFDLGFGGSVSDNAAGRGSEVSATGTVALVGVITKLFSVIVWALGFAGAAVAAARRRRPGLLVLIGFTPLVLPFVNSYGGEIIYRAYLYSLPGMVGLIALLVVGNDVSHPRRVLPSPRSSAVIVSLALAAGFLVVHYSREQINHVDRSEVALEELVGTLPDEQYIAAQFSGGYPGSLTARYPMIQVDDTYTPQVDEMLDASRPLTPQLDGIADDIVALTDGTAYLVVTPGMIDTMDAAGELPLHSVQDVLALLATSDRFVPVTHIGDSWLLRVLR